MGSVRLNTSNPYVKLDFNWTSSIVGSGTGIKYRCNYEFRYVCTGNHIFIHGLPVRFGVDQTYVTVNPYFDIYSGQSITVASGVVDFPWNGTKTTNHGPGINESGGFGVTNQAVTLGALTVPEGSISANLQATGHNSVDINVSYNSPYNFWKVKIYNTTGYLYKDNCVNGVNTISGLNPGTSYTFNVELWDIYNNECVKRVQLIAKTTGSSYVDTVTTALIGGSVAFNLKTYSDSFKNVVTLKYGSTVLNTQTIYSTSLVKAVSYTFNASQNDTFYKAIPNATTIDITATVETYSGSTLIGTTSKIITLQVVKTAIVPTITFFKYRDTSTAVNKTSNDQYVVQSVSSLVIDTIVASARYYSTIVSYRVDVSNQVYTNSTPSIKTGVITVNTPIVVTITDSRGLTASLAMSILKYIPYIKPTIQSFILNRVNGYESSTYLIMNGIWDRLSINNVHKNTDIITKYRYKESTSSAWGSYNTLTPSIADGNYSYNKIVGDFDQEKSYDFELYIGDYFRATTLTSILTKAHPELSIREGSVGINKVPSGDYKLEVNGSLNVESGIVSCEGRRLVDTRWLENMVYLAASQAGVLVEMTNLNGAYDMLFFEIKGHGYTTSEPIDTIVQVYLYTNHADLLACKQLNKGAEIGACSILLISNKPYLWVPNVGNYNSFAIRGLLINRNIPLFLTITAPNSKPTFSKEFICEISQNTWKGLTLATGWTNYASGWDTPAYRIVDNIVYLRGLVVKGTTGTATIATLPLEARPVGQRMFTTAGNGVFALIYVYSTGIISLQGGNASAWLNLHDISFPLK